MVNAWNLAHPDKMRDYRRKWDVANRDHKRDYATAYYAAHPDKLDKKRARGRAYMAAAAVADPEKIRTRRRLGMAAARERSHEKYLERERRYRATLAPLFRIMRTRDYNLKHKYGKAFGLAEYEAMLVSQLGGCAICGKAAEPGKHFDVDHDHNTGMVRALLCRHCNQGMIAVDRCPEWPERARAYTDRHKECRRADR